MLTATEEKLIAIKKIVKEKDDVDCMIEQLQIVKTHDLNNLQIYLILPGDTIRLYTLPKDLPTEFVNLLLKAYQQRHTQLIEQAQQLMQ